jgi:MFS family permease
MSFADGALGMFWWHAFWDGQRDYWWRFDAGELPGVCVLNAASPAEDVLTVNSDYGLINLGDVARANLSANIVTTLQCGCFVGALAAGPTADKFGRRPTLMLAAVLAIIGTIMQAVAFGEIAVIFVGRFIAGLGVGGASMVTPLYSELCQALHAKTFS